MAFGAFLLLLKIKHPFISANTVLVMINGCENPLLVEVIAGKIRMMGWMIVFAFCSLFPFLSFRSYFISLTHVFLIVKFFSALGNGEVLRDQFVYIPAPGWAHTFLLLSSYFLDKKQREEIDPRFGHVLCFVFPFIVVSQFWNFPTPRAVRRWWVIVSSFPSNQSLPLS